MCSCIADQARAGGLFDCFFPRHIPRKNIIVGERIPRREASKEIFELLGAHWGRDGLIKDKEFSAGYPSSVTREPL
jgi:hypothetical protein